MAAFTLVRGITGFKLVFQSKCLRMDVAGCYLCSFHFDTVSSAKKRKLLHEQSVSMEFSTLKMIIETRTFVCNSRRNSRLYIHLSINKFQ